MGSSKGGEAAREGAMGVRGAMGAMGVVGVVGVVVREGAMGVGGAEEGRQEGWEGKRSHGKADKLTDGRRRAQR